MFVKALFGSRNNLNYPIIVVNDVELVYCKFAQHDGRVGREEVLPPLVFSNVFDKSGDPVRLQAELHFIEQRDMTFFEANFLNTT